MKFKINKKLLLSAISLFVVICLCAVSYATYFNDAGNLGAMYEDAINFVSDNGIMDGDDSGNFNPYTLVTRGTVIFG